MPNSSATSETLREAALGDWIGPQERLQDDADFVGSPYLTPFDRLEDRQDGKFLPLYQTEQDLRLIRGQCRNLMTICPEALGLVDNLANYILGPTGFTFEIVARKGFDVPAEILAKLNSVVEMFQDCVRLSGNLDREIHQRSREDGEFIGRISLCDSKYDVEIIEPVQVTEPNDKRALEDWLDCDEPSSWSFGVHTPARNTASPKGYFVSYAGHGGDWEYYPACETVHVKRNVTRNAKRGVSDIYAVIRDLRAASKLGINMVSGAALQAAIAWIEEHPPGTSQGQVQGLGTAGAAGTVPQLSQAGSSTTQRNVRRFGPGTILQPSPGKKYAPGPLGAERNNGFVEVAQYALRMIGVRWNMPEYMISGDASNANYASSMVAESPFVKARERDQAFYSDVFKDMLLKAMKLAFSANLMDLQAVAPTWDMLRRAIDIDVTTPRVETRDNMKDAQAAQIYWQIGALSAETVATEQGYDWQQELERGAKPSGPMASQPGLPGLPMSPAPAVTESTKVSIKDLQSLDTFFAGYP